jgi:hypothetical protein
LLLLCLWVIAESFAEKGTLVQVVTAPEARQGHAITMVLLEKMISSIKNQCAFCPYAPGLL